MRARSSATGGGAHPGGANERYVPNPSRMV